MERTAELLRPPADGHAAYVALVGVGSKSRAPLNE